MSIVLVGFDISSRCTGYSKYVNGELVSSGTINFYKNKEDSSVRLKKMKKAIIGHLLMMKPDIVVVEKSASNNNIKIQRMLSEINGIIEGYCILNNVEYVTYTPAIWRMYVRDKDENLPKTRKELKVWAIKKVYQLFPNANLQTDDEAEAILIGLARINEIERYAVVE